MVLRHHEQQDGGPGDAGDQPGAVRDAVGDLFAKGIPATGRLAAPVGAGPDGVAGDRCPHARSSLDGARAGLTPAARYKYTAARRRPQLSVRPMHPSEPEAAGVRRHRGVRGRGRMTPRSWADRARGSGIAVKARLERSHRSTMGGKGMKARLNYMAAAPGAYKAMSGLEQYLKSCGL